MREWSVNCDDIDSEVAGNLTFPKAESCFMRCLLVVVVVVVLLEFFLN